MTRKLIFAGLFFVGLGIILFLLVKPLNAGFTKIQRLEHFLAGEDFHLTPLSATEKPFSIELRKQDLNDYRIYARNIGDDTYLLIGRDGNALSEKGPVFSVRDKLLLFLDKNGKTLFVDGKHAPVDLSGYEFFCLTKNLTIPEDFIRYYSGIDIADGFMRAYLFADSNWISKTGTWRIKKYGAGLSDDLEKLEEAGLPRAVNPFSVRGSGNGILSYGQADNVNYRVAASFYFGRPQTTQLRDTRSLPGSFFLIQGYPGKTQVKFGWDLDEKRFVLAQKSGQGAWKIMKKWKNLRPTISSWCKLGLEVKNGCCVKAYLDGVPALEYESDQFIHGPFHIACGTDLVEFDDVRAFGINNAEARTVKRTPFYRESTNFAVKKVVKGHDELQYQKWAQGKQIYEDSVKDSFQFITSSDAVPGDIYYESIPHHARAGELNEGNYVFKFLKGSSLNSEHPEANPELFSLKARRSSRNWTITDDRYPEIDGKTMSVLRISRLAENGNRPAVYLDKWVPVGNAVNGFIHVSVGCDRGKPQPEHHQFSGTNIVNELFEQAPINWRWTEGKFRMASRWACSDQWNFMACGGTGTPWMAGNKRFWGDQSHEYYMSLRPIQPPEGGDDNFSYNPREDKNWQTFIKHFGWYNKHDLDFAFCTDGVNPMSGYAVLYAADENTANYLLRKGKVVAKNDLYLMPDTSKSHHPIHWKWWNFRCSKAGNEITVKLNDDVLFKFIDKEPLEGGHVGFFTVRNGFAVAKIDSMAEKIDRQPFFMWVEEDAVQSKWYPLVRDGVRLEKATEDTIKVTQRIGGGSMAVRHDFDDIDLGQKPVLAFPLKLAPDVSVNLFLMISGKSYVIQLNNNSLRKTKALLTPEFEKGEMFQLPFRNIDKGSPCFLANISVENEFRANLLKLLEDKKIAPPYHLESITIGNSSEDGFLAFGAEKNRKGVSYQVGEVRHGQ